MITGNILNYLLFILCAAFLFSSCEKDIHTTEYRDTTIVINSIPEGSGVFDQQVRSYINKCYLDVLGREASSRELELAGQNLKSGDFSQEARREFLELLLSNLKFYKNLWYNKSASYLNGIDSSDLNRQIFIFNSLKDQAEHEGDILIASFYEFEVQRLRDLQAAAENYYSNKISTEEFYSGFCLNFFYDEINMGTENFVLSCFENYLGRLPTQDEQFRATEMVDGFSSTLFLESGNNKLDFVSIVMNSEEFYEFQTRDIYLQLVGAEITESDLRQFKEQLIADKNLELLFIDIMISEAYAGF